MHDETASWFNANVKNIWEGREIDLPHTHLGNELKSIPLSEISRCAWTGITPKTLVHMIENVVLPKYKKKAARLAGHIHSFTSETLQDIWQIRTDRLKDSTLPEKSKISKYQTADEKAKILIDQKLLPGIGSTGKITLTAYMNLPKKHRLNKVQKYLKSHHGHTAACVWDRE